jgi:uncharacterized membrane protein YebE (DUF533 family)
MKNPISAASKTMKGWSQGVGTQEILGGCAGLIATQLIPPMIIKTQPVTTTQKLTKLALAAGVAMAGGMIANKVSKGTAKAVVIGGLAGVVATAISTFTTWNTGIARGGNVQRVRAISSGRVAGSSVISPAPAREQETVSLITP